MTKTSFIGFAIYEEPWGLHMYINIAMNCFLIRKNLCSVHIKLLKGRHLYLAVNLIINQNFNFKAGKVD